jgi:glyoxylase-like metal-dependent hydrolase (beta-lactamase superfamily II)
MKKVFARRFYPLLLSPLVFDLLCTAPAESAVANPPPAVMKKVAPDLYFHFDYDSSNSIVWVTEEGVLVVDTRKHPRQGQELIDKIRTITDKPIRWAVVTQAHGDHYFGNQVFKEQGATIVSQMEAAPIMEEDFDRGKRSLRGAFERYRLDPSEIKLTLPDVTFEKHIDIHLGGKVAQLIYFGPAEVPGDAFVYFPHVKALATGGAYTTRHWTAFGQTPSVEQWIAVLRRIMQMDVNFFLPGHGDVGTKQDVQVAIGFLTDLQTGVKDAIDKGMNEEQTVKALTFPQYKNWRAAENAPRQISNVYHLLTTGKPVRVSPPAH